MNAPSAVAARLVPRCARRCSSCAKWSYDLGAQPPPATQAWFSSKELSYIPSLLESSHKTKQLSFKILLKNEAKSWRKNAILWDFCQNCQRAALAKFRLTLGIRSVFNGSLKNVNNRWNTQFKAETRWKRWEVLTNAEKRQQRWRAITTLKSA